MCRPKHWDGVSHDETKIYYLVCTAQDTPKNIKSVRQVCQVGIRRELDFIMHFGSWAGQATPRPDSCRDDRKFGRIAEDTHPPGAYLRDTFTIHRERHFGRQNAAVAPYVVTYPRQGRQRCFSSEQDRGKSGQGTGPRASGDDGSSKRWRKPKRKRQEQGQVPPYPIRCSTGPPVQEKATLGSYDDTKQHTSRCSTRGSHGAADCTQRRSCRPQQVGAPYYIRPLDELSCYGPGPRVMFIRILMCPLTLGVEGGGLALPMTMSRLATGMVSRAATQDLTFIKTIGANEGGGTYPRWVELHQNLRRSQRESPSSTRGHVRAGQK